MSIKSKIFEIVVEAGRKKLNLYDAGKSADKALDEKLGEKSSEKVQRITITSGLFEFMNGLWAEEPMQFALRCEAEAGRIRKENKGR